MMIHRLTVAPLVVGLAGLLGCTGAIRTSSDAPGSDLPPSAGPGAPAGSPRPGDPPFADPGAAPLPTGAVHFASAARRLTQSELRLTLLDLVGLDLRETLSSTFPDDWADGRDVFAFDNKYTDDRQHPSEALIGAAANMAEKVADAVIADPAVRAKVTGSTAGCADEACLRRAIASFGRRALRRPLPADEVELYAGQFVRKFAASNGDWNRAVSLVVRTMLQEVEFLYRIEVGKPAPGGALKLEGHEVASRLSYFLWGTTPDEALLSAAETGDRLQTVDAVRAQAARMLADPRAKEGVRKFHAMWMGWERNRPAMLEGAMLAETNALVERAIFEQKGGWLGLFTATETFVDGPLAAHYGLPRPASGSAWVPYGASGRKGILSHGAFLGTDRKFGDDPSPTMRGLFIRTRLLCQEIPGLSAAQQEELGVDTDERPAGGGGCKSDSYDMWKQPKCQGCHVNLEPLGFALENFDQTGKHRTHAPSDAKRPECAIAGEGTLAPESGPRFKGPAGLADELVRSGALEACMTRQLAHYLLGRELAPAEEPLVAAFGERFRSGGHRFEELLLDFVTTPGFGHRLPSAQ